MRGLLSPTEKTQSCSKRTDTLSTSNRKLKSVSEEVLLISRDVYGKAGSAILILMLGITLRASETPSCCANGHMRSQKYPAAMLIARPYLNIRLLSMPLSSGTLSPLELSHWSGSRTDGHWTRCVDIRSTQSFGKVYLASKMLWFLLSTISVPPVCLTKNAKVSCNSLDHHYYLNTKRFVRNHCFVQTFFV